MILGRELKAELLVVDDYMAREHAKYLGFKVTGTLGIILKSKEQGIIECVKPLVDKLVDNGIYIDDKLYQYVLQIAGEQVVSNMA
jgi:predicted nucleic acid-binding protein